MKSMADRTNDFMQALLSLDRSSAKKIMTDKYKGNTPLKFIEEVVVVALEQMGVGWQNGTVALSQVYMGGRICEDLVDEILPPESPERKNQPRMAICVLSDHHILGKLIVYSLLRASGFDLADYGVMEVDSLVDRVKKDNIEILLISVLMLPSALQVKRLKGKLKDADLDVKIIVGGAPFRFDEQLWQEVGADAMCRTASEALTVIREFSGGIS